MSSLRCASLSHSVVQSCGLSSRGFSVLLLRGKAMTSLMSLSPLRSAHSLSKPMAMPPCGGAPYLNAFKRKSKVFSTSSYVNPSTLQTLACKPFRWILMLPPPNSTPFSTMSYAFALTAFGSESSLSMSSSSG